MSEEEGETLPLDGSVIPEPPAAGSIPGDGRIPEPSAIPVADGGPEAGNPSESGGAPLGSSSLDLASIETKRQWAIARKEAQHAQMDPRFWKTKLGPIVRANTFREELAKAHSWLDQKIAVDALGLRCTKRTPEDIKRSMASTGQKGAVTTMGGSLAMINLTSQAYPGLVSPAKVQYFIENKWTGFPSDISSIIGTVLVNAELWDQPSFADLSRASSDAEPAPQM
jgi:hypothetical protein